MLTDVALKALKPGPKPYKRADGGGLYILVQPNGKKIWRLAYRFAGKQKLLSGGAYPGVGIRAARTWREQAKAQLTLGLDPSGERRKDAALVAGAGRPGGWRLRPWWIEAGRARPSAVHNCRRRCRAR